MIREHEGIFLGKLTEEEYKKAFDKMKRGIEKNNPKIDGSKHITELSLIIERVHKKIEYILVDEMLSMTEYDSKVVHNAVASIIIDVSVLVVLKYYPLLESMYRESAARPEKELRKFRELFISELLDEMLRINDECKRKSEEEKP